MSEKNSGGECTDLLADEVNWGSKQENKRIKNVEEAIIRWKEFIQESERTNSHKGDRKYAQEHVIELENELKNLKETAGKGK